jgi:hypothetical protein
MDKSHQMLIHRPLGITYSYHPLEKVHVFAYLLKNQFTPHELRDENHKRRVVASLQALLETMDRYSRERLKPCEFQTRIKSLQL